MIKNAIHEAYGNSLLPEYKFMFYLFDNTIQIDQLSTEFLV